jgi:hypothetical protein
MEDKRILDHQITASSHFSNKSTAYQGRLETKKSQTHIGAWSSNQTFASWLQIDLGLVSMVTKVATQGRHDADQWVKTYVLMYSIDGIHWATYKDQHSNRKVKILYML